MIVYMYYLNKLTDLIETVFFVMKKSWRQVTFLHVYHHASVIACNYIDIYLQPGKRVSIMDCQMKKAKPQTNTAPPPSLNGS